ncbi:GNAT family N-acetyltransferase [Paenibacillus chitinolyticus]|uniref:GNAT family N-acetyltransferase n=1 Tax=Paenibacillus chitinolyticus TaxID=79263 RepID=UPI002DB5E946|nr:GNAT family N-acetyltransferase [Paenibacillus chitinolyticus]MEC0244588.1 GNAT family N-acetyltransferase [Paenibacillus chitinolyticus]
MLIKMSGEDQPFLFELYCSSRMAEVQAWGWGETALRSFLHLQYSAQTRSYQLQYPEAEAYIVCQNGQRAGRILIHRTPICIRIVDIALLPQFQNQGLGTNLLHTFMEESREQNLPLRLSVLRTGRALALYERLGFQIAGQNDMYLAMEWNHETCKEGDR